MAVAYDPLVQDEPYAAYRALRRDFPVYRNEERGFWALSRFEDVQRAARQWRSWSSAEGVNLDDTLSLTGPGNFIAADPPGHDRLRRVVRERFTPATIATMEPAIRADVRATLEGALRAGGLDAAAMLAWAIPAPTGFRRRPAPPPTACARTSPTTSSAAGAPAGTTCWPTSSPLSAAVR
jgi:cytochrome P450